MIESREGMVFEYTKTNDDAKFVRKSATKTKGAHYQLKKNRVTFMIEDMIGDA